MLPCMKRLAVSSRGASLPCLVPCVRVQWAVGPWSREVPSALYSRSSRARGTRRRMRGFEGWGRHLRSGPATAAKPTFALTHPSNLRETIEAHPHHHHSGPVTVTVSHSQSSSRLRGVISRVKRGDRGGKGRGRGAGRIHRSIPEERIENAGQAAGERDDGDVLASARGDAQGPGPEGLGRGGRRRRIETRRLDEQPANTRVARLGDGAAALRVARAVLAGHEAEVGFELMRVGKRRHRRWRRGRRPR